MFNIFVFNRERENFYKIKKIFNNIIMFYIDLILYNSLINCGKYWLYG